MIVTKAAYLHIVVPGQLRLDEADAEFYAARGMPEVAEASRNWKKDGHDYGCYAFIDWNTMKVTFPCNHTKEDDCE